MHNADQWRTYVGRRDEIQREVAAYLPRQACDGIPPCHGTPPPYADVAACLARQGCHMSLPPGKVACHLHEAMRLSGLVPYDTGPLASD